MALCRLIDARRPRWRLFAGLSLAALAGGTGLCAAAEGIAAQSALFALPSGNGNASAAVSEILALAPQRAFSAEVGDMAIPVSTTGGAAAQELKPGAGARRIAGSVVALPSAEGGKRYLRMEADYEAIVELPFDILYATLLDFEAYPCFFGRVALLERLSSPGTEGPIRFRQRTTVRVLWLDFSSEYEFDAAAGYLKDGKAGLIGFRSTSGDGALVDVLGGWYLEARGSGRCYVRYRVGSSTREDFSGQKGIMASFMDADFRAVFRQLGAEAGRRARTGG